MRYWPNETGSNAESQSVDRLSFFAYAPWVEVTPATGIVTATGDDAEYGIVSLTRNGATYVDGILVVNKTYSVPKEFNAGGGLNENAMAMFKKLSED